MKIFKLSNIFKSENVLNIFCDASITNHNGETIGCPGAIVIKYNNDELYISDSKFEILRNTTNNKSELTAIFLALQLALKYRDIYPIINIFSDSKISVFGLRDWIFSWINTIDEDGIIYSSSGLEVANQDIIKKIINFVVYNKLRFNLFHQKGHVTSTENMINRSQKVFNQSNNILIDRDIDLVINKYNNIIDNQTRNKLKEECKNIYTLLDGVVAPIKHEVNINTIDRYNKYINKNIV